MGDTMDLDVWDRAAFAGWLRTQRQEAGLSLRQLQQQCGVGFNTLARMERGKTVGLIPVLLVCRWGKVEASRWLR